MEVHLKELFARFQEQFGSGPGLGPSCGTCLLKVDGISPAFVKSLFHVSAALYRSNPWRVLRPGHLFGVRVGKDSDWSGKKQPFSCAQFVGGDLSLHLFKSEQDALKMITATSDVVRVPNLELLRVTFELDTMLFPSNNKRMIRSLLSRENEESGDGDARFPDVHAVRCMTAGALRFRNPTLEELRYVFAVMKAFMLIHPLLLQMSGGSEQRRAGRLARFEPLVETVDVQWPSELACGYDLVAVTFSHPPGQAFVEKKKHNSSPARNLEQPKVERPLVEVKNQGAALRQCAMCRSEIPGEQSICCGRCKGMIYCGSLCQKQHWKDAHKGVCGLYKAMVEREEELIMSVFMFACFVEQPCKWLREAGLHQMGMWRRRCGCNSHYPFGLLPTVSKPWGDMKDGEYPPNIAFPCYRDGVSTPILLSGWSEYYNLRSLPMSSPVAALLSHPLTVYHILTSLAMSSKSHLAKDKEEVVHYVGAESELDWMPAFVEVGHLLNGSGSLQIMMVGPEVPSNLSGTSSVLGSRVKVNPVRGLYQDVATDLPSPHVVVGLNCGFTNYNSWGPALELINSINVPAFFTEQTELACSDSKQVLRSAGLHVTHPVTPNPFRSPLRDWCRSSNLPSFSNCFIFGVNTSASKNIGIYKHR